MSEFEARKTINATLKVLPAATRQSRVDLIGASRIRTRNSNGAANAAAAAEHRLLSIGLWILSIVCVCLTATNLYLLVWVWTSLAASSGALGGVDLFANANHIKLNALLASKQALTVGQVRATESAIGLSIASNQAIHLGAKEGRSESLLSLWPTKQLIATPFGWTFKSAASGKTVMQCRPSSNSSGADRASEVCELKDAHTKLRLGHARGVDFGGRSAQTGKVRASRLHSQTNRLELRASRTTRLSSSKAKCHIESMESLRMGGRKSAVSCALCLADGADERPNGRAHQTLTVVVYLCLQVILDSERIGVDARALRIISGNSLNSNSGRKLCICLPSTTRRGSQPQPTPPPPPRRRSRAEAEAAPASGLVFALAHNASCASAAQTHCVLAGRV